MNGKCWLAFGRFLQVWKWGVCICVLHFLLKPAEWTLEIPPLCLWLFQCKQRPNLKTGAVLSTALEHMRLVDASGTLPKETQVAFDVSLGGLGSRWKLALFFFFIYPHMWLEQKQYRLTLPCRPELMAQSRPAATDLRSRYKRELNPVEAECTQQPRVPWRQTQGRGTQLQIQHSTLWKRVSIFSHPHNEASLYTQQNSWDEKIRGSHC